MEFIFYLNSTIFYHSMLTLFPQENRRGCQIGTHMMGIGLRILCYYKLFINYSLTLIGRGFWMLLESGGGLNQPTPSRSPQNTVKNQKNFFDFLKVHNELGKVTKFWTSRPLFSWRNSHLKKVRADSALPPH